MRIRKHLLAMTMGGALAAGLAFVPQASAAGRVIIARPFFGFGYGYAYRPFYGPVWGYRAPAYVVTPATGEVKIDTKDKNDTVYVDGGYIGTTRDMKKFSLRPGNHDIDVRNPAGNVLFHERVQVLLGKTVDIRMNG